MSNRHLRRDTARACSAHKAIVERCKELLAASGAFQKDAVIKQLALQGVADAIRWDYIREFIHSDEDVLLVPMAAAFFKRHAASLHDTVPHKFVAVGHGKKTAGYVSAVHSDGAFARVKLKHIHKMSNGTGAAYKRYAESLAAQGLAIAEDVAPKITDAREAA